MKLQILAKLKDPRTNWKYILLVVILAFSVSVWILGYLRYVTREMVSFTQLPEVKKQEKGVKEEIVDWKTYRNEEYGFEIKYPRNWDLEEASQSKVYLKPPELLEATVITINFSREPSLQEALEKTHQFIYEGQREFIEKGWPRIDYVKEEQILLDNIPSIKISYWEYFLYPRMSPPMAVINIFVNENKNLRIEFSFYALPDEVYNNTSLVVNEMLSTFRFLK